MKAPPRSFMTGPGRPFDAVLVSSRCHTRIEELSAQRPDALLISANAPVVARNGIVLTLMPQERTLFLLLVGRRGGFVPYQAIEEVLWGDDPDGGATATRSAIGAVASRLRPAAALLGLRIQTHMHAGMFASDLFSSHQHQAAA